MLRIMQQLLMAVSNRKRSEFAKADTKKNKNVTSAIVTAKELTRREGCLNFGARMNTTFCWSAICS